MTSAQDYLNNFNLSSTDGPANLSCYAASNSEYSKSFHSPVLLNLIIHFFSADQYADTLAE